MSRVVVVAALTGLCLAISCVDEKNPAAKPEGPLAPAAAVVPEPVRGPSTVCRAFERELARVHVGLRERPADTALRSEQDALETIIADACN